MSLYIYGEILSQVGDGHIIMLSDGEILLSNKEQTSKEDNGIRNALLALAVPLIIKGEQAVVNKIKIPGANTLVGEVGEKRS